LDGEARGADGIFSVRPITGSHGCRYLLIDSETGREVVSIEAQLPPFTPADEHRQWRVAYKAPSVPDAAVAVSD